mmetsp:Transcript_33086/g.50006  ORF Transcript_33086/g.50006 Transcript_33086/m.50006 type:complete len:198 (+) Transcript_33086:793-1386(+)
MDIASVKAACGEEALDAKRAPGGEGSCDSCRGRMVTSKYAIREGVRSTSTISPFFDTTRGVTKGCNAEALEKSFLEGADWGKMFESLNSEDESKSGDSKEPGRRERDKAHSVGKVLRWELPPSRAVANWQFWRLLMNKLRVGRFLLLLLLCRRGKGWSDLMHRSPTPMRDENCTTARVSVPSLLFSFSSWQGNLQVM